MSITHASPLELPVHIIIEHLTDEMNKLLIYVDSSTNEELYMRGSITAYDEAITLLKNTLAKHKGN